MLASREVRYTRFAGRPGWSRHQTEQTAAAGSTHDLKEVCGDCQYGRYVQLKGLSAVLDTARDNHISSHRCFQSGSSTLVTARESSLLLEVPPE